uniref:RBR-type E3 ubiquitin transferase n=1 Tax=Macrostomum lignano TaxID=282301 RepID=A0A1I8JNZ3_9PLAT
MVGQRCAARVLRGLATRSYVRSADASRPSPVRGLQCPAFECPRAHTDEPSWCCACLRAPAKLRGSFRRSWSPTLSPATPAGPYCPGADCECVVRLLDDAVLADDASHLAACGKTICFALRSGLARAHQLLHAAAAGKQKNARRMMSTQWFMANTKECPKCHATIEQDWHEPISCSMLRRWQQKNAGESMSTQWFMANTKETAAGNHMKCRNATCNHEFCWVCMDDWQPHGKEWYNCNRFDEERAERVRRQQALSRNYLSRYLHYYDLYMNHLKSLEFEARLQETVHSKMDEMQYHGLSWIE